MAPKTVEADIASIFSELELLPAPDDHLGVLAVLADLRGAGDAVLHGHVDRTARPVSLARLVLWVLRSGGLALRLLRRLDAARSFGAPMPRGSWEGPTTAAPAGWRCRRAVKMVGDGMVDDLRAQELPR